MPVNSPLAIRIQANVASKSGAKIYEGQPIEVSVRAFRDETIDTWAYHAEDGIHICIRKIGAGDPDHSNSHHANVLITYKGLEVIFADVLSRLGKNRTEVQRLANLLLKIRDNCMRKL